MLVNRGVLRFFTYALCCVGPSSPLGRVPANASKGWE
jgi:hypothetical protein